MALIINGRALFGMGPGTLFGVVSYQANLNRRAEIKNIHASPDVYDFAAIPNGAAPGTAWLLARTPGGGSAVSLIAFVGSGAGEQGRDMSATGNIVFTANTPLMEQIYSMIASGSITFTSDASGSGAASMVATGSITFSANNPVLGAPIDGQATGTISFSGAAVMTADAFMTVDLTPAVLTADSIAQKIFDESDIETGYSMREAMRLILSALAGKVSGGGTTTITIRNVTDNKNRITATVDSNGNRTAVTYNVSD